MAKQYEVDFCEKHFNKTHTYDQVIDIVDDPILGPHIKTKLACIYCGLEYQECEHEIIEMEHIIPADRVTPQEVMLVEYCRFCKASLDSEVFELRKEYLAFK